MSTPTPTAPIMAHTYTGIPDDPEGAEFLFMVASGYGVLCVSTAGAEALTSVLPGAGQIWLDEVGCTGEEVSLLDCPSDPLGSHNCVHSEDAGVRCRPGAFDIVIRLKCTSHV